MPDSVTQILAAGPPGSKINIAVVGDGFAAADQDNYNDKVNDLLIDGVFGHNYFYEDAPGFNIFRVNLIANESGVSQRVYDEMGTPSDGSDDVIVSTTLKDTALGYIYSGSWAHCWLESGASTASLVDDALDTWVPDWDLVVVILNEPGFGGCGGGGFQIVTLGSSWAVMAHEFGHGAGGLADDYCTPGTYTGAEPGAVNVTANTNSNTLEWRKFVNPSTPIPTGINANPGNGACTGWTEGTEPADWDNSQSVGLFEGAQYRDAGKYRPAVNCRMRGNSPPFCPVCHTELKTRHHDETGHTFRKCYPGDFNGDGKDDLLIHNGNSILMYRSDGAKLDLVFSAVERVPGSWQFKPGDRFYVGDFNGDGKDEGVVYNSTDSADTDLLYAAGFSNGAGMVWQLLNSPLEAAFQGFAAVGLALDPEKAQHYRRALAPSGAAPSPAPVAYIMGTTDSLYRPPFSLREAALDTTMPAFTLTEMLDRNDIPRDAPASTRLVAGSTAVTEVVLQLFEGSAEAFLLGTVINGGHNWPTPTTRQPSGRRPFRRHRDDRRLLAHLRRSAVTSHASPRGYCGRTAVVAATLLGRGRRNLGEIRSQCTEPYVPPASQTRGVPGRSTRHPARSPATSAGPLV